jgi:hypothetical protein
MLELRRLYLPQANEQSWSTLESTNYPAWERVQRVLDSLQRELFGDECNQSFYDDLVKLLDGGMIYPSVKIDPETQDAQVRFLMWGYLSQEYKPIEDLDDYEFDILEGMLEYFARVN